MKKRKEKKLRWIVFIYAVVSFTSARTTAHPRFPHVLLFTFLLLHVRWIDISWSHSLTWLPSCLWRKHFHSQESIDHVYLSLRLKKQARCSFYTYSCLLHPTILFLLSSLPHSGHAYSVTGAKELHNFVRGRGCAPERVRLVRVRNPWGNDVEWKGDWSDNSPLWQLLTPEQTQVYCESRCENLSALFAVWSLSIITKLIIDR